MTRAERNYIRAILLVCFLILPGLECKAHAQGKITWENSVIVAKPRNYAPWEKKPSIMSFATSGARGWETAEVKIPDIERTGTFTAIGTSISTSRAWDHFTFNPTSGTIMVDNGHFLQTWAPPPPAEPEDSWVDRTKRALCLGLSFMFGIVGVMVFYLLTSCAVIRLIAYSGPSNMFERADTGERFVLPEPNDPRWVWDHPVWKLGMLEIGYGVRVDGDELKVWPHDRVRRYYTAIGKAVESRRQDAILAEAEKQIMGDT